MSKRRNDGANMNADICPKFDKKLQRYIQYGRTWEVAESTGNVYEVKSIPSVFVNIEARTCTCCKWQLRGFPCVHAVSVILKLDKGLTSYVECYFYADFYRKSYSKGVCPIATLGMPVLTHENAIVILPITKKPAGRPRKDRFPKRGEKYLKVRQIRCSRCRIKGHHNKLTCKAVLIPKRRMRKGD